MLERFAMALWFARRGQQFTGTDEELRAWGDVGPTERDHIRDEIRQVIAEYIRAARRAS